MLLIKNYNNNPAFNLAAEEYLLTVLKKEIISLWRNAPAVIIGRNQNAIEEINLDYVKENDITVIRRQTGGGAVFHDLGNINYTVIQNFVPGDFNNYAKFTAPVRDYLQTLGVDAQLSGRNDLTVDDMKISGNAQTVKGNMIMHHGTLLISLNMGKLAGALKPKQLKIESKGIKSVRSRVTNIASYIENVDVEQFFEGLSQYFLDTIPGIELYEYTEEDLAAINKLVEEKYSQWEWNFGHSPEYDLEQSQKFDFGLVDVRLKVESGIISEIYIYGDFFGLEDKSLLEKLLTGIRHEKDAIMKALENVNVSNYISGMTTQQLVDMII